ncbi:DUF433 domain-containing protein [Halonotius terrestris]|uniref:DUF433 domain-containing protein n=1 Tax=Halonotius terrestris TaxID=2487750 RepID=A0A8J8TE53_9EURY|nr:DUF433 domain-containing protein [Halonotius terrestris]TQQ83829.1 DUF433 domain-containing protein [Halonotius terrestris]
MSEIVSTADTLGGAPRIEGRRIGVHHIAARVVDGGEAPITVAAEYDLDIADVHRALTYYYDNPEEMRRVQAERQSVPDSVAVVRGPDDLEPKFSPNAKYEAAGRRTRPDSVRIGPRWRRPRCRCRRQRDSDEC